MATARRMRIVIPGGSGQIGQILARHFHEHGHSVCAITRHPLRAEWQTERWDGLELGDWTRFVDGADVVINLAGRSVDCRYNEANRREIKNSRVITTGLVGQAIARAGHPPRLWLNASTATIYRHSIDRVMDEQAAEAGVHEAGAPDSWAFSIDVATSWERALFAASTPHTRRVALRSSMVMNPDAGSVFDRLLHLVRLGLGGTLGAGNQFVSWIHEADFLRAVEFVMETESLNGPVNICSPCPVPNRFFMRCLRHAWCSSYIGLPSPSWALRIGAMLTGTETELILKSRRVVPGRLTQAGFEFHFPSWRAASQDLVTRWRELHSDSVHSVAAI